MRYARILSWTLFVLFFLVYLTAIKLVRGNQWQAQQHFIHQVAPLYTFQYPYQTASQTQRLIPAASSVPLQHQQVPSPNVVELTSKEGRELGANQQHVTFGGNQDTYSLPPVQQQQHQPISRRNHLSVAQQAGQSSNIGLAQQQYGQHNQGPVSSGHNISPPAGE